MKTDIQNAITVLTNKITPDIKSDDALRFTQAVLNLAHALGVFDSMQTPDDEYAVPF